MMVEWLDAVSIHIISGLVNGLWGGLFIVFLCWAITHFLAKKYAINASTRYSLWFSALILVVGLIVWHGSHGVPSLLSQVLDSNTVESIRMSGEEGARETSKGHQEQIGVVDQVQDISHSVIVPLKSVEVSSPKEISATKAEPFFKQFPSQVSINQPARFIQYLIFLVWSCISGFLLMRLIASLFLVRGIKKRAKPASKDIVAFIAQFQSKRSVGIGISEEIPSAVAVGYFHPMILLPREMINHLSEREIKQVALHELAHICRKDDLTILMQQIISALFFFHPGVMVLNRLMNRDREMACDDWVVSLAGTPKSYATCLARLATLHLPAAKTLFVAQATAGNKQLIVRVKNILNRSRRISIRVSTPLYVIILSFTLVLLSAVLYMGPVVAFTSQETILEVETPVPIEAPSPVSMAESVSVETALVKNTEATRSMVMNHEIVNSIEQEPIAPPLTKLQGAGLEFQISSSDTTKSSVPDLVTDEPARTLNSGSLGQDEPLSKASMIRWLKAVRTISSPSEKSALLRKVAPQLHKDAEVQQMYIEVANSVSSPSDRTTVLLTLIETGLLQKEGMITLLEAVKHIGSDSSRTRVLLAILNSEQSLFVEDEIKGAFKDAMKAIASPTQYEHVVEGYIKKTSANK